MVDEDAQRAGQASGPIEEPEALTGRFPEVPAVPELPDVPEVSPELPPHPERPRPGPVAPGSYGKMAVAATAATSFIMPVIVLGYAGWWLDQKFRHTTAWFSLLGVILGFAAGVAALLKSIRQLSD
ncbi:MAG: AtpZ/AtpI family protein [Chloroherpetonaceae bacterium]|nr:AtpZ/AtpI family protein [Chthonomonadaceae bacterium]MDW8207120.1 AtpZ/AtpI family protein [Chloroherpetonaceae bacterium]